MCVCVCVCTTAAINLDKIVLLLLFYGIVTGRQKKYNCIKIGGTYTDGRTEEWTDGQIDNYNTLTHKSACDRRRV